MNLMRKADRSEGYSLDSHRRILGLRGQKPFIFPPITRGPEVNFLSNTVTFDIVKLQ